MAKRLQIIAFLGLAMLAWFGLLLIRGTPVTWEHAWPFGTVASFLAAVVAIFDRWAWSWSLFQNWFVKRPDLRGTWRVVLQTDWVDRETGQSPGPIICYMAVRQTLSSLSMRLMTPESTSWLTAHKITLTNDGIYQVAGVYTNKPQVFLRGQRSEIHYGAILLDVKDHPPQSLSGHYWTDRKTRGTMNLSNRIDEVFESHESARSAFKN
jgi:hypothetical protein